MLRRGFLQLLSLVTATGAAAKPLPAPAPPRVPLVEAFIAGFRYHDGLQVAESLKAGDALSLVRDPGNSQDARAIRLLWKDAMLGFLPRRHNDAPSRLLDHGRRLEARIVAINPDGKPWERVKVVVELVG